MRTIKESSEDPNDVILTKYKRAITDLGGGVEGVSRGGQQELTPPNTPPCPLLRETALLHQGEDGASLRDSRSSHSSGHTVGGDEDFGDDKSSTTLYEPILGLEHCGNGDTDTHLETLQTATNGKPKSESSNKPELKSYFGKSMLPGLSGLHGLSSIRNSSHSPNKNSSPTKIGNCSETETFNKNTENVLPNHPKSSHGGTNGAKEEIAWVSKRLQAHRQLSSSDSWGSEDFESYSSNEDDCAGGKEDMATKMGDASMNSSKISADSNTTVGSSSSGVTSSAGREKLKARLLRKREQWRERRQSSSKDFRTQQRKDGKDSLDCVGKAKDGVKEGEETHAGVGSADAGKLSRWFSLRKSVNYDVERKSSGGVTAHTGATTCLAHPTANSLTKPSDNDCNIPTNDIYPPPIPNSSTLSSISSFSSNSSSSTNSSSSSFAPHHNNTYHFQHNSSLRLPQLLELEERMSELEASTNPSNFYRNSCGGLGSLGASTFQRKHQPPTLPPLPPGLTAEQIKRRHIVASIVHSENNYVATLHRLVREYRKPLDDSKPPILNQSKVAILFHYVHEILQCHTMFRIALTECVRHWDRDEKIGDFFFASFSKGVVLDIYSEFINNFTRAMEVAKMESRKKSVFADFLKMRQITSPDRLSFFGMMVKPVQRFPQFILFLQDLLKYTPKGHPDRMSLQLALTQLESLAETLNEQKRESEQHQAFKATLKQINSKFALRNISEGNRCLIRQDDVSKLEFGPNGLIKQTKERRLFLTTDTVICVSVVPKSHDEFSSVNERLSLKWVFPITEIEVQENNSSLTLSRLLAAGLSQRCANQTNSTLNKQTNSSSTASAGASSGVGASSVYDSYHNASSGSLEESEAMVGAICAEMNDLMHDYQVVSRIAGLVATLKGSYETLTSTSLQHVMGIIQQNIQSRDDRMSWLDGCCLQIKAGKDKEVMTFHVQDPTVKKDWIIELRLAQLAVSSVNSPAWDSGDQTTQRPPSRRPLFVTALPILHASQHTMVVCGCQYPLQEQPRGVQLRGVPGGAGGRKGNKFHTSVWLCSTDGVTSHITRYVTHQGGIRECIRVSLPEVCVTAMLHVPPHRPSTPAPTTPSGTPPPTPPPLAQDTVWIGTLQNMLMVYSGSTCDDQEELFSTELSAAVASLIYHCQQVFIGLTNGELLVYQRSDDDGCWRLSSPVTTRLSDSASVTALLPLSAQLYAAVADTVMVLDCGTLKLTKQLFVHHGQPVSLLAHSGIGLWLCEAGSSTVCLYHTESCRHLQDIDLAPSVTRMLGVSLSSCTVMVTALVVSRGLLWVGTSVGVTLTLPLPRLQGVPIISGRPTLSYHAHTGPVTFLMTLMQPDYYVLPNKVTVENTSTKVKQANGVVEVKVNNDDVKKKSENFIRRENIRKANTLPRGFGGAGAGVLAGMETALGEMGVSIVPGGSDDGEVMGLCSDLLRHWSDDESAVAGADREQGDSLRRSDPSLSCMSSTLDRRLRLRDGRPRSLDLSSASIDSKVSAATTSSGSEDGHTMPSRQSTIHEHFTNETIPESEQSRKNSAQESSDTIENLNSKDTTNQADTDIKETKEESITEAITKYKSNAREKDIIQPSSGDSNISKPVDPDVQNADTNASTDTTLTLTLPGTAKEKSATESGGASMGETTNTVINSTPSKPANGKDDSKNSSHKRSNSDITRKSLSSSTSNISSLCYDGDVDTLDITKASSNSSDQKKIVGKLEVSRTGDSSKPTKSKVFEYKPSSKKDCTTVSRQTSITNTLNRSIGTLSRSPTTKSTTTGKGTGLSNTSRAAKDCDQPRTVLVLTGGQGYKCMREDAPTNGPPHNNTDAHILVWEMKL